MTRAARPLRQGRAARHAGAAPGAPDRGLQAEGRTGLRGLPLRTRGDNDDGPVPTVRTGASTVAVVRDGRAGE